MGGGEGGTGADVFTIDAGIARQVTVLQWDALGEAAGVVLFFHGARSAPWKYLPLISAWRAQGFAVWAPLHVDSTDHPLTADYPGLATWSARLEDARALATWVDAPHIAAGHSYGALTALALGGARGDQPADIAEAWSNPEASALTRCVLAFSPPPAIPQLMTLDGYAALARPALIQTGTVDAMPGWPDTDWQVHLDAWHAAPASGDRYLLVLDGVDHTFGGTICEPDASTQQQHAALDEAVDTARLFTQATFHADASARAVLNARLTDAGPSRLEHK